MTGPFKFTVAGAFRPMVKPTSLALEKSGGIRRTPMRIHHAEAPRHLKVGIVANEAMESVAVATERPEILGNLAAPIIME